MTPASMHPPGEQAPAHSAHPVGPMRPVAAPVAAAALAEAATAPPAEQNAASTTTAHPGAAPANGEYVDPLTRELGRAPTWAERAERARAAAKRLGYPKGPPPPPVQLPTPEEHAAQVAQTKRICAAIREELNGWQFKGTEFFRDMRDGKLKDEPNAYWRPPASDHAGA